MVEYCCTDYPDKGYKCPFQFVAEMGVCIICDGVFIISRPEPVDQYDLSAGLL